MDDATTTTADSPPLDHRRMLELARKLKASRPKVDCFLMMKATAADLFEGLSLRKGVFRVKDTETVVFVGLPLHIAANEGAYIAKWRQLNDDGLRVGIVAADIPEDGGWKIFAEQMVVV